MLMIRSTGEGRILLARRRRIGEHHACGTRDTRTSIHPDR
jgi:hypothetical protein